jgi:thioesterase domain-containing protein/acyl carrier protein
VPSAIMVLERIPLLPNGKINRPALPSPDVKQTRTECVEPRDIIEFKLQQIWELILRTQPVGVTDNFFELGGHSFLAIRLMAEIQSVFGRSLPVSTLFQEATIERLASVLRGGAVTQSSHLIAIQPNGSRPPLFCIHPSGGGVLCYVELARELGLDQPFYAIESPGLDERHEPSDRLEDMAARYIEMMRDVQPHGPYFLGGWSMGGVIAYEAARQLIGQGDEVATVVLIDSWLPRPEDASKGLEEGSGAFLGELIWHVFGRQVPVSEEVLKDLEPDERLKYIWEQAKLANIIPADVKISNLRCLIDVFQTNVRALQNYAPKSYPGRVALFRASEHDPEVFRDMPVDWKDVVRDGLKTYTIPGNHFSIMKSPQVQELSQRLSLYLDEARQAVSDHE